MPETTYIVLSFNLSKRSELCTRQSFRRFETLHQAMLYGAAELLIRDGVVILRNEPGSVANRTGLELVAACGAAESRATALYVMADYNMGRWPVADYRASEQVTRSAASRSQP